MKKVRGIFLLTLLIILLFPPCARTQIYFGITPIRVELSGNRGESITDIFYVRNNASSPIRLRVYVENWTLREDGTPVFIGADDTSYSCKDWIKVNPQDFRLNPEEIKVVRYTLSIPDAIDDAGFHASVSFENVPLTAEKLKASKMRFTGKISAVVYVKVGNVDPDGEICDMRMTEEKNPPAIVLSIKNTGKTHFRTNGTIEIRNTRGKKVHEVTIPDSVALPESERKIKCLFQEKPDPGTYEAFCKLDIGGKEILGFTKQLTIQNEK
jgi:P pilus assembly chaperone PapD